MDASTGDLGPALRQISEQAPPSELTTALQTATVAGVRQHLCKIIAERCEARAIPTLIQCLDDVSPQVRSAAAEALGKIGDPSAGSALFEHFSDSQRAAGMECMLAAGLGSLGYRLAIPRLIEALRDPSEALRGVAAWSLGILGAREAADALRSALTWEQRAYNRERIGEALTAIDRVAAAFTSADLEIAQSLLIPVLDELSPVVRARRPGRWACLAPSWQNRL